jgi:hypothetical protein
MKSFFFCFGILITVSGFSQPKDTELIKAACVDYVEGFFTQDSARLRRSMHPDLIKRIIDNRSGKSSLQTIGLQELISYLQPQYKSPDPKPSEPFTADVTIYDVRDGIALAKITTNKMPSFFDYAQLGKINGRWMIINVLWAFYS